MSSRIQPVFYHDRKKVDEYIESRRGFDGSLFVREIQKLIERDSSILEIGMGSGNELLSLAEHFKVTGSDYSDRFLSRFRELHPGFNLMRLDAVSLETDRVFDCIFSNKVLHHLDDTQFDLSLQRQCEVVKTGGLLFHTFWLGDHFEEAEGLVFRKFKEEFLVEKFSAVGRVVSSGSYAELIDGDSIYVAVETGLHGPN